jgi:hypothetical protein
MALMQWLVGQLVVALLLPILQTAGMCDLNPLTRNILASANSELSFELLALKMVVVIVGACLDSYFTVQTIIIVLAITAATALLIREVSGSQQQPGLAGQPLQESCLQEHCFQPLSVVLGTQAGGCDALSMCTWMAQAAALGLASYNL